jgi:hypothetical protein
MTKKEYLLFISCTNNKGWNKPFVGKEIWREYLWDFLVYPHQSKQQKTIKYNECIKTLPKLEYFTGPRIIYNSAQRLGFIPFGRNKSLVKFVYKLKHSNVTPVTRILIIEYAFIDYSDDNSWEGFTKKAHECYAERLLEMDI